LPEQHLTIPESVPAFGEITSRVAKSSASKPQRTAHA